MTGPHQTALIIGLVLGAALAFLRKPQGGF